LFWRDRKAGGVLIENVFHGKKWKWAIVGIGININQVSFDKAIKNPVSLKQITGKEFDTVARAKELYTLLMKKIQGLSTRSFDKILEDYNTHLYKLNKNVLLKIEDSIFETVIKTVSAEGKLLTVDSTDREFDFGEVEWVL
jgi:BirA family biotin operon repressor/biotin-[acetyl-CoA-carboxylase] ligase